LSELYGIYGIKMKYAFMPFYVVLSQKVPKIL